MDSPGMPGTMIKDEFAVLMRHGEENGCVGLAEFTDFVDRHELESDEVDDFYRELESHGVEVTDDCGRVAADDATYVNGDLNVATTDALQLFLNEAGRYSLLTAAEEVELAKLI